MNAETTRTDPFENNSLWLNDMSLPWGGKFDVEGDYSRKSEHSEHRLGETIDVRSAKIRKVKRDSQLEIMCKSFTAWIAKPSALSSPSRRSRHPLFRSPYQ